MSAAPPVIRRQLVESIRLPLGLLVCLAAVGLVLHLQQAWSVRCGAFFLLALSALALYQGAEGVTGDRETAFELAREQWPVSRARWWVTRLLLQGLPTLVCALGVSVLVAALSTGARAAELSVVLGGLSPWLGGLTVLPAFAAGFFASSVCRNSASAFVLGVALSWGLSLLMSVPLGAVALFSSVNSLATAHLVGLRLGYAAVSCVALLVGSYLAFSAAPGLDYRKRVGRAVPALLAIVLPAALIVAGFAVYRGLHTQGGPTPLGMITGRQLPFGGGSSTVPTGVSAAEISPDGRRLAFVGEVFDQRLWVVNADGSGLRRLSGQRVDSFLWLKDSRRLVLQYGSEPATPFWRSKPQSEAGQWAVLDLDAPGARPVPIAKANATSSLARLSPRGRYLFLDGQIIEVGTWQACGQVQVPNYSPWLLTWLPDDSALYARDHSWGGWPSAAPLTRIGVPSGQVTTVPLPPQARLSGASTAWGVHLLSDSSDWCHADRSTRKAAPARRQRVILRSTHCAGPGNELSRRTRAEAVASEETIRTLLYQLSGKRSFQVEGLRPVENGLSPSGRYCLLSVTDGATERDDRADWYAAFLDMSTGKVVGRVALPGLTAVDNTEGGFRWSPDEQWVAVVARRWDEKNPRNELLLGSRQGQSARLRIGPVGGWVHSGVIGWTNTGRFVVIEDQTRLVSYDVRGQKQVIVEGKNSFEELARSNPGGNPRRGGDSGTTTGQGGTTGSSAGTVPTATPQAPPTARPRQVNYPDPTPESLLAALLDLKPGQVHLTPVAPPQHAPAPQFQWEGSVQGERYTVTTPGPGEWGVNRDRPKAAPTAPADSLTGTRATAGAALQRRFGAVAPQWSETSATELPGVGFTLNWSTRDRDTVHMAFDASGKLKSYSEHRAVAAGQGTTSPAGGGPSLTEVQETPESFAATVLGVPRGEIPAATDGGTSWWEYQVRGRTYHVEHSPFRWGLQLWSDYQAGRPISHAQAVAVARRLVQSRFTAGPGASLSWRDGDIARYSFDCSETYGPRVLTGDTASVVLYPDGTLLTYEERRVLPKLTLKDIPITEARARQIAGQTIRYAQRAEGRRYTLKSTRLALRPEEFRETSAVPVWYLTYTPSGTPEQLRRNPPRYGLIRIDAVTGGLRR